MDLPSLIPPTAAVAALLLAGQRAAAVRRRRALNRGLHEIRRSLQSMMLFAESTAPVVVGAVGTAASALEELDREVNRGVRSAAEPEPVEVRPIAAAAVERWRPAAARRGANLGFRWRAGRAVVLGRGPEIARVLDNLLLNAIEHGGEEVELEVAGRGGDLAITVHDRGRRRPRPARGSRLSRLAGRERHGHGLAVVRRVVAGHGGRFELEVRPSSATAAVLLPVYPLERLPGGVAEALR